MPRSKPAQACARTREPPAAANAAAPNPPGPASLRDCLPDLLVAYLLAEINPPAEARRSLVPIFRAVEQHFAQGGSFEELERQIATIPEIADPNGPIGLLWVAIQTELERPVRAPEIHLELARDILHSLKTHGVVHYVPDEHPA